MAFSEVLAPCRGCHQERPFRQHHADHLLHLLLTIFTGGLWLPVWLLAVWYPGKYRCAACGMKYRKPRRPLSPYFVAFGVVALVLLTIGVFRGFSGNSRSRPVAVAVSLWNGSIAAPTRRGFPVLAVHRARRGRATRSPHS